MTLRTVEKVGMRVVHKHMGMWKGEIIGVYGDSVKVRWDATPRRETWVAFTALEPINGELIAEKKP